MAIRALHKPVGSLPMVFHADSFVSERLGFVYHCVPKALSRSMLEYLTKVDPDGYRIVERNVGVDILKPARGTDGLTSFSFVRNPYSRAVAVYYDKFVNYRNTAAQRALFGTYEQLRPDMSFAEFVDWLSSAEGSDDGADPHFLSQHYFLLGATGAPAVEYVGKVESVGEDVSELQRILGLEREVLPHVNSNTTRERESFDTSQRWLEVLDDRSKRLLARRYDGDFELLGYQRLPYTTIPLYSRGGSPSRHLAPATSRPGAREVRALLRRSRLVVNTILAPLGLEIQRIRERPRRAR